MTLYPDRELTITSKVQEFCGWEFAAKLGEFDYSTLILWLDMAHAHPADYPTTVTPSGTPEWQVGYICPTWPMDTVVGGTCTS